MKAQDRKRKNPHKPALTRFLERVRRNNESGCLEWIAGKSSGYGRFNPGADGPAHAYRWFYEYVNGPIDRDLVLDHLCRNKLCVEPTHLEPVTISENFKRGAARYGRLYIPITHCKRGHDLSIHGKLLKNGKRRCHTCRRELGGITGVHPSDRTHCPRGHLLYGENLYVDPKRKRRCRTCGLAQGREWRQQNSGRERNA
jgi:hypothetical protein